MIPVLAILLIAYWQHSDNIATSINIWQLDKWKIIAIVIVYSFLFYSAENVFDNLWMVICKDWTVYMTNMNIYSAK